MLESGEK